MYLQFIGGKMNLLISLFLLLIPCHIFCAVAEVFNHDERHHLEEEFSEELLLKPLPDRKILAHFYFTSKAPATNIYGHHHQLFPKAVYQLAHKFRIREMELSFTQGRWNYEKWGGFDYISISNAKPPGAELWATFDVPHFDVDAQWRNLTHALSGLFCASVNFLESSAVYTAPSWSFRNHSSDLRYGALPREAVCTENLTPWLKLLPCRDKAGIALLLDRPSIYQGFYHSQRVRILSTEFDKSKLAAEAGILLEQTLTVVLQPRQKTGSSYSNGAYSLQPRWSLSSLFGRKVTGKCLLAKSSSVFLEFDRALMLKLEKGRTELSAFEVSPTPNRIYREATDMEPKSSSILYHYIMDKYDHHESFDLTLIWRHPTMWSCHNAPFHASRFLLGSGNARGSIAISLESAQLQQMLPYLKYKCGRTPWKNDACYIHIAVLQIVPWYVRVYYHTLEVFVDGQLQAFHDVVEKIHIIPSEDKISPGLMELLLKLPFSVQSAALILQFEKGFLHIDEYPPDANQGFDIPSAILSFPDFSSRLVYDKANLPNSPLLFSGYQEQKIAQLYTEILLVPLTTPDFSMPYNVITFTCTVLALYFGSLVNVLRRRVGEEERLLKRKDTAGRGMLLQQILKLTTRLTGKKFQSPPSSSSLSFFSFKTILKVVLVALLAVIWNYLSNR